MTDLHDERIDHAAVDRYLDLDLGPASAAARDLDQRVEREAAQPEISLTGDGDAGALSANLTPAMSAWLNTCVERTRRGALAAVKSAAANIRLAGGVQGIVDHIEVDELRRNLTQRRAQFFREFHDRHHDHVQRLESNEREYNALRAQLGGRDAKVPGKLVEYGIPALILVPEFFMNYASFVKLSGVPAIGFGLSIVVALAVAVSSFMAGTFWKAYHYHMHPDDEVQRAKGLRRIGIASTLLSVAMSAVAYARYHMVLEQVQAAAVLGLPPPNIAAQTAGLLAGNLLVFAIGAAITYLQHDENPDYADKAIAYGAAKDKVDSLRQRDLFAKLTGAERALDADIRAVNRKAGQMEGASGFRVVEDMMSRIEEKDAEVLGRLTDYRMLLVDRLRTTNPRFTFHGAVADRRALKTGERITPGAFSGLSLYLYRSC